MEFVALRGLAGPPDIHTSITRSVGVVCKYLIRRVGQRSSRGFDSHHPLQFCKPAETAHSNFSKCECVIAGARCAVS